MTTPSPKTTNAEIVACSALVAEETALSKQEWWTVAGMDSSGKWTKLSPIFTSLAAAVERVNRADTDPKWIDFRFERRLSETYATKPRCSATDGGQP